MTPLTPEPGASAALDVVVGEADTATALGSGDVPVLATPRVLALAERATVEAVAGAIDDARTTVGAHVELDHLRPSFVGALVRVEATLRDVQGRKLLFDFEVIEGGQRVATGSVTRFLVRRESFTPPG